MKKKKKCEHCNKKPAKYICPLGAKICNECRYKDVSATGNSLNDYQYFASAA